MIYKWYTEIIYLKESIKVFLFFLWTQHYRSSSSEFQIEHISTTHLAQFLGFVFDYSGSGTYFAKE